MKNFFKIITDFIANISLDLFAIFLCMLFVYKTGPSIGVISFFIALIMYLILHFVFYSFREKIIKKNIQISIENYFFEVQVQRNKTEQLKNKKLGVAKW